MFRTDPYYDTTGTQLIIELPDITTEDVERGLGPLPAGFDLPAEEYSTQWCLRHSSGVTLTLYTCFGEWRIGGRSNVRRDSTAVVELIQLLNDKDRFGPITE